MIYIIIGGRNHVIAQQRVFITFMIINRHAFVSSSLTNQSSSFQTHFSDLFESNFSLFNKSEPAIPYSANKTEYNKSYTRKPLLGKLAPLKRPLNLTVDACEYH